jgi:hypothetical protein
MDTISCFFFVPRESGCVLAWLGLAWLCGPFPSLIASVPSGGKEVSDTSAHRYGWYGTGTLQCTLGCYIYQVSAWVRGLV